MANKEVKFTNLTDPTQVAQVNEWMNWCMEVIETQGMLLDTLYSAMKKHDHADVNAKFKKLGLEDA